MGGGCRDARRRRCMRPPVRVFSSSSSLRKQGRKVPVLGRRISGDLLCAGTGEGPVAEWSLSPELQRQEFAGAAFPVPS